MIFVPKNINTACGERGVVLALSGSLARCYQLTSANRRDKQAITCALMSGDVTRAAHKIIRSRYLEIKKKARTKPQVF